MVIKLAAKKKMAGVEPGHFVFHSPVSVGSAAGLRT
jgi:hypothetical protein